jgi:hypothetical protein
MTECLFVLKNHTLFDLVQNSRDQRGICLSIEKEHKLCDLLVPCENMSQIDISLMSIVIYLYFPF